MTSAVSLVATVKNESRSIDSFLASLLAQTRAAEEIVVVDGGSSDGTLAALERVAAQDPRIRVVSAPGATIARGRNLAIAHAHGPIIAVADAGTVAEPTWLEELVAPLELDPDLAVSSGFYLAGGETWFERCLTTVITPHVREVDPARFLPSSRSVAFRKHWWASVGGYPEWLRHCEDLVFDFSLRHAGASFAFAPEALVTWKARPDLGRFFRQYFDYARGDGHALLWPVRHAARYLAYASGAVLLVLGRRHRPALIVLVAGMAAHFSKYEGRVARRRVSRRLVPGLLAFAVTPLIVVTGDVAKMLGFPVGLYERATGRVRPDSRRGVGREGR